MLDIARVKSELTEELETLRFEISTLARVFKETNYYGHSRSFLNARYGYMMACMGKIDVLSYYWLGPLSTVKQTPRMKSFMNKYLYPGRTEEHGVAVQMFRHTLMHTGALRFLYDKTTGTGYTWRARFDDQLPPEWHYKVTSEDSQYQDQLLAASVTNGYILSAYKALNVDIVRFADDIYGTTQRYLADLETDPNLQLNYEQAHPKVLIQAFKS